MKQANAEQRWLDWPSIASLHRCAQRGGTLLVMEEKAAGDARGFFAQSLRPTRKAAMR
jgi:hypothetical protein